MLGAARPLQLHACAHQRKSRPAAGTVLQQWLPYCRRNPCFAVLCIVNRNLAAALLATGPACLHWAFQRPCQGSPSWCQSKHNTRSARHRMRQPSQQHLAGRCAAAAAPCRALAAYSSCGCNRACTGEHTVPDGARRRTQDLRAANSGLHVVACVCSRRGCVIRPW